MAKTQPNPDFVVFSAPLAVKQEGDHPTLVATASSNAVDLEADRFTEPALKQMRDGFKGRLIFMNHSYKVPQDVFGIVEETALIKREGRIDLDMVIRVETGNPLAVQTFEYVVNGTRLGVSVGVIVTEADKTEDEDEFGKRIVDISGVIPLEASVVGIPANQTAWTQQAVKSLFERGAIDFDEDEIAARPWLTEAAIEKEDDMSKSTTKHDEEEEAVSAEDNIEPENKKDEEEEAEDSGSSEEEAEEKEEDAEPEDKKDEEGEDEEGGGDDEHDADEGDGSHSEHDDEHKEDNVEPDEEKGDFEEAIAADEAADLLIDKMYTGFRVALNSLVPIVLEIEMSDADRATAGAEVIEAWKSYIEESWDEVVEALDTSKGNGDAEDAEDFDLDARLHDLISNEIECGVEKLEEIEATAAEIGERGAELAKENEQLTAENKRLSQAVEYAAQVVDTIMQLPLPTVTDKAAEVAPALAEDFPNMDTEVVERLARYAPPRPTS